MKLSRIVGHLRESDVGGPLAKAILSPEQQDDVAQRAAGDDGEANTQIKKQLRDRAAKPSPNPKDNKTLKTSLQKLQSIPWDSSNSQFNKEAGKVLGSMK